MVPAVASATTMEGSACWSSRLALGVVAELPGELEDHGGAEGGHPDPPLPPAGQRWTAQVYSIFLRRHPPHTNRSGKTRRNPRRAATAAVRSAACEKQNCLSREGEAAGGRRSGEGMGDRVKVFGMWASPFALRVEWALKLKGVEYEYVEEDLLNNSKSPELLRYNPVHKKVPILVHGGHPVAESLVIVEYVDEAWKDDGPAILPADPYERAQARFWAKFAEDKILPAMLLGFYSTAGEERQQAAEELKEKLKIFGEALKGKKFFGGETIGYVDIAAGWIAHWLPILEEIVGVKIVDARELPEISAWMDDFLALELVKQCLPPRERLHEFNKKRREQLVAAERGQP